MATNLVTNLIARTHIFDAALRRSRMKLTGFQRATAAINAKLALFSRAATFAGAAIGALSIKSFATFEQQMANVSTMLDKNTMRYMPMFTEGIKKMSVEFGEGTETISKGLYDILSASIAPAKAMSVLAVSVKAAKAGLTDTAVAADAITTILNSYQMSADQAGKVSDILFAIVKRGKTTFGELAPNIGKVAAIASVAGLSIEEVGAALATMTRAGMKTELATTSLRGIINSFLQPTAEAAKAAEELGFTLNTATLRSIGLTGVLMKLKNASAEQLGLIMPNVRAMAGFAAQLKQATAQAEDHRLMLNALGLTQEAFEKNTSTLAHSLNQSALMMKITAVNIGGLLAPMLKRFARSFFNVSESLIDLKDIFSRTFPQITFVLKNFGTFLEYAMVRSAYHIVKFGNQVKYVFVEVIGSYLKWLQENWKNAFMNIWNFMRYFSTNLGLNLGNLTLAISDAIAGKGWNFVWRPLLDGFESALTELPKIARRQMGPLELALKEHTDSLLEELGEKYNQMFNKDFTVTLGQVWRKLYEIMKPLIDLIIKLHKDLFDAMFGQEPIIAKKKPTWMEAGEGREIDTSLISVKGLAMGSRDNPIYFELTKQTEYARQTADNTRKTSEPLG